MKSERQEGDLVDWVERSTNGHRRPGTVASVTQTPDGRAYYGIVLDHPMALMGCFGAGSNYMGSLADPLTADASELRDPARGKVTGEVADL